MEITFTPFAHDYYIINLPNDDGNLTLENKQTLFDKLKYSQTKNYRGQKIGFAPVIRLYGIYKDVSICVHVHGYFPYFYIKIEEIKHLLKDETFILTFIDHIHQAYVRTYFSQYDASFQSRFKLIYNYELVEKIDFYGLHLQTELFLKLYLYDQQYIRKLAQLLHSSALMNFSFQAYEAHLNYFMHFYADRNIFGMTPINIYEAIVRRRLKKQIEQIFDFTKNGIDKKIFNQIGTKFLEKFISQGVKFSGLSKVSFCTLEIDCHYSHLVNQAWNDEKEFLQISHLVKELNFVQKNQNLLNEDKELVSEFNVELTLTLNQLWKDEEIRRNKFQFDRPKLIMDKRNNKEGQEIKQTYPSVNLMDELEKVKAFMGHIQNYQESLLAIKSSKIEKSFINFDKVQSFFNGQQGEMETCKNSMISRFKEYMTRKKDLFELIKEQGNVDYEYKFGNEQHDDDWEQPDLQQELDEEEEQDLKNIIQTSQDILLQPNIFETMKNNQKLRDKNKFRKKYKVNRNLTKQLSIFELCIYCNNTFFLCNCFIEGKMLESQRSMKQSLSQRNTQEQNQSQEPLDKNTYIYNILPPKREEVMASLSENQNLVIPQQQ